MWLNDACMRGLGKMAWMCAFFVLELLVSKMGK